MNKISCIIQGVFGFIGGVIGFLLGGIDGFIYVLLAFVILDIITGLCAAGKTGKITSMAGWRGGIKKVIIFCVVAVAHLIDLYIIQTGDTFRTATIFFYVANEGISIIENLGVLNVPFPTALKKWILKLHESESDNNE